MGQCLSQQPPSSQTGAFGDVIKGSAHHQSNKHAKRRFLPPKLVFEGRRASSASADDAKHKAPKLTILTTTDALEATSVAQAPLTGKTAAETPASTMSSPLNASIDDASDDASSHEAASSVEGEEPLPSSSSRGSSGLSLVHFFQSLRHTQELDHVIPEEVDPDAPSDEEDERLLQEQALARKNPPSTKNTKPKSTAASPPRPQDRIKMQFSRSTRPDSIVNRNNASSGDSKVPGSVSSKHISEFRKLKLKVKLAAKQERKKARIAKLEDRYEDVRGYNSLWQDYQEIQGQTERTSGERPKLKRSDSFDLHDTGSWFFDFQSFDEEDASAYDFDDDASQSSLSLLSTASMESQRKYFQEKRQGRTRRNHSDMNLLLMNQIIHTKKPLDESTPMRPKYSPSHTKLSTPPSILRGKKIGDDTTPGSRLGTPESRGPVAPKMNAFEMATGEPEYHCYRRPGEKPVDHDEDTPKAKSRRKNASYVEPTDVDTDNDYQVTRRRRAASANDADFSILPDERNAAANLGITLPPSPPKRDFEYSSFAIEVVTTDQPDVRVMRMSPKPNENTNRKEKIVSGNAAKCLEETANAKSPLIFKHKTKDVTGYRYEEPPMPTIASMSTEDFLMFSSDHALVNVSNNLSHEILLDSSSSLGGPSDKENGDAATYDDIANDVTEQIDVLLEKYRQDNEDSIIHPSSGEVSDESIEQEQ